MISNLSLLFNWLEFAKNRKRIAGGFDAVISQISEADRPTIAYLSIIGDWNSGATADIKLSIRIQRFRPIQ